MIVITGQTGTGKTAYALKLAKKVNGELINCDSRQIYKELNIVTGKDLPPNCHFEVVKRLNLPAGRQGNLDIGFYLVNDIPIWLYDVVSSSETFSSYEYKLCALEAISAIQKKGKTPIIVGGTYLYIKSLLYGFETEKIPPDWELREELEKLSVQELQVKLISLDSGVFEAMNNSDQNNPRRLMRKIEIVKAKGHLIPYFTRASPLGRTQATSQNRYLHSLLPKEFIALKFPDDATIREVIEKRVRERFAHGAVEETRQLLNKYKESDPGLQTIGYKELIEYGKEEISKDEMIQKWITAEVQYAKRQYTFMKKNPQISWLDI